MASSPTIPDPGQTDDSVLHARAHVWRRKPLLRDIYRRYFDEMISLLARPDGKDNFGTVIELGGGAGNFKEYFRCPGFYCTDIVPTPHIDMAVDAMRMPFGDKSINNIIMQDVLHHIPYPLRFFDEALRVLVPGGRIVMTEPYISPASRIGFCFHPEPVDLHCELFSNPDAPAFPDTGPWASNQAIPTLLFYKHRKEFLKRYPDLRFIACRRHSLLVYPLSGGFSRDQLIPAPCVGACWALEKILAPAAPLLAYRAVIALEKCS